MKKTKSTKLKISEELSNLIEHSTAAPAVLVNKLVTDHLKKAFDKRAAELLRRRASLIKTIVKEVCESGITARLWRGGCTVTLHAGTASDVGRRSRISAHPELEALYKGMSVTAPKTVQDGVMRTIAMKALHTGPAFLYLARLSSYYDTTEQRETLAGLMAAQADIGDKAFIYGTDSYTLTVDGKKQAKRVDPAEDEDEDEDFYEDEDLNSTLTIGLEALSPNLSQKLKQLVADEAALMQGMLSDMLLVAGQAGRPRNMMALLNKLPDLLDHPHLKEMLGYDENPQADRIATLASVMSGEALLSL